MRRIASRLTVGALIGAGTGLLGAGAYLLLGGEAGLFMPDWAVAAFLPGVLAGHAAWSLLGLNEGACVAIGVGGVGVGYAVLGLLVTAVGAALTALRARR